MKGAKTMKFEVDPPVLPKPVAVEVPMVVEVPTAPPSEVKAAAEVLEASSESGLAPENPSTE